MMTEQEKAERDARIERRHQFRLERLARMDAYRNGICPTCGQSKRASQPDTALYMRAAKR